MSKVSILMTAIDEVSPATRSATTSQQALEQQLDNTRKEANENTKQLRKVDSYQKQVSAVEKVSAELKRYEKQLNNQRNALKSISKPTQEQSDKLATLEQKVTNASIAVRDKSRVLVNLERDLKDASISTDKLEDAQHRLQMRAAAYTEELKKQSRELREYTSNQTDAANAKKIDYAQHADTGLVAAGGTLIASGAAAVTNERSYTQVRMAADSWTEQEHAENNNWTQDFAAKKEAAGTSASDLNIYQAGAIRGGFDTVEASQKATEQMVQLATVFKIDDPQLVVKQFNKIKQMGVSIDEMPAFLGKLKQGYKGVDAEDYIDNFTEVSQTATHAGFDLDSQLAMASAITKSGGNDSDVSSFMISASETIGIGKNASEGQQKAWEAIGMTAEEGAEAFKKDSQGTLKMIFQRLKGIDADDQFTVAEGILGTSGGINMKTIANNDYFTESLNQVNSADGAKVMNNQFDAATGDSQASLEAMISGFNNLAVAIGTPLLEPIGVVADVINDLTKGATEFARKQPELTAAAVAIIAIGGAASLAKKALSIFKSPRTINAAVININGRVNGSDSPSSDATGRDRDRNRNNTRANRARAAGNASRGGRAANMINKIKGFANVAKSVNPVGLGMTALAATKTYDSDASPYKVTDTKSGADAYLAMHKQDEEQENKYKMPELPIIPDVPMIPDTVTIPTVEDFEKKEQQVIASVPPRIIQIDLTGEVKGLEPAAQIKLIETIKDQLVIEPINDDREGYS